MVYSAVAICNLALDEVTGQTIASLDDQSKPAQACNRLYWQAWAEALEMGNWQHARARLALTALDVNDREGEWTFAYQLPSDMAQPVRLLPPVTSEGYVVIPDPLNGQTIAHPLTDYALPGLRYALGPTTLYANVEGAVLEYVSNTTGFTAVSALFVRFLSLLLASKLVMPLRQDRELKNTLLNEAGLALATAQAANINREPMTYGDDYVSDSQLARMGEGPWPVAGALRGRY